MTAHELFLMAEQVYEDLTYNSFTVTLSRLAKEGWFEYKPYNKAAASRASISGIRGQFPGTYLRIKNEESPRYA